MVALQDWLDDTSARRNIFVVAKVYDVGQAAEATLYLSNCNFITDDGLTIFDPVITGNFAITESLDLSGNVSISYGDIDIYNNNGERDSWLNPAVYVWVNRDISVYVGDSSWTCADAAAIPNTFHLIFSGLIADIDSKSLTRLSIKVRDKQEKLNTPVIEELMDSNGTWNGEQPNKDEIKPLVFGEVHNIEPVLIDPATLKYRFSVGASEQVIEIRDNGVPIYTYPSLTDGATVNLTDSTFVLTHPPAGQITASIQGRKRTIDLNNGTLSNTYTDSPAKIILVICRDYGKVGVTNLAVNEIDLASFIAIDNVASYPVGIYLGTQKQNIIDICRQLATSIGAQIFFNRFGILQLIRIGTYTSTPSVDITTNDIIQNSLSISNRIVPVASTKLAYCKNWTVQSGIVTGIPDEHKEMFASEWYYSTSTNNTTKSLYKLNSEVEPVQTMLLTTAAADAEAARLTNYFSSPRTVYRFTGKSNTMSLQIGQQVKLYHFRFNLWNSGNGTIGQVVSVSPDWVKGMNEIEVIV